MSELNQPRAAMAPSDAFSPLHRDWDGSMRILLAQLPVAMYVCRKDVHCTVLYINDAVEALTGYPAADFLSGRLTFMDIFRSNDADGIIQQVEEALVKRQPYHLNYRIRHQSGRRVLVEETGVGVFNGDQLKGLEGFLLEMTGPVGAAEQTGKLMDRLEQRVDRRAQELHDLTCRLQAEIDERQQAEIAARDSERRLQSILDNTTAVVYVKQLDGKYLLINNQFCHIFDLKHERVRGSNDFEIFDEAIAHKLRDNDREVIERREPIEFEEVVRHKDGKLHTYISIKFPLYDMEGRIYATCGISTDITDRKLAEQAARQHRDQLAHVARLSTMGEMASGLAHELNQPLTAISNYAHGCLRHCESGSLNLTAMAEVAGRIAQQADRAGQIIQRLCQFVKKGDVREAEINIGRIIKNVSVMLDHDMREAGVSIELQLDRQLPMIVGDDIQIEQVILNLLRNAIEASFGGEGLSTVTISGTLDEQMMVVLQVADHGHGADREQLRRMFEPFFTTKPTGMGMGLNISQTIVEAHGGRMWAMANPDGGLSVFLSLPSSKDS